MSDFCRSCRAPVMWLDNVKTGKRAPIDTAPVPDGNVRIGVAGEHYSVLAGQDLADARERGDPLHLNHFVTCEQAPAWKARAAKAAGS